MTRSRWVHAWAVAITIVLGLASRRYASRLPWWLAKNAGDALYATMVFFAFAFVAPRARVLRIALAATAVCFAIETSQLYQADWIVAIRDTRPGGLVLGHGFHAFDLACYVVGIALAIAVEHLIGRSRSSTRIVSSTRVVPLPVVPQPGRSGLEIGPSTWDGPSTWERWT